MHKVILDKINEDLCDLNIKEMFNDVNKSLSEDIKPLDIIKYGLIEGLGKLSKNESEGKAFFADVVYASSAVDLCCQMLIGGIRKITQDKKFKSVVIGSVKGDMHQIGKNIAKYLLQAEGVNVIDLGCSVESSEFSKSVEMKDVGMVICTGELTASAQELKNIVSNIKLYRNDVYVAAAGSAFDANIVNEARADIYIKTIDEILESVLKFIEI